MKRVYKGRSYKVISCQDCFVDVKTNSSRTLRCMACAKSAEYRSNMLDYKWRLNKLLASAKFRAVDKKLPFNLTQDYLIDLWDENSGRCVITGRSLELSSSGVPHQVNSNAPSIDRIIPKLGYVVGNVRLVTYHANVAISEFGYEKLITLCSDITNQATQKSVAFR
jgi:hypothetical protein